MKKEKTTIKKLYQEADLLLYQMAFNKNFKTDLQGKKEQKLIRITPICKECADYVQVEMIRQLIQKKYRKDEDA